MKLQEGKIGRVVFARLSEDEDLLEAITLRAKQTEITSGFFILIGAVKRAKIGFYRQEKYKSIEIAEPLEIASCMGNISVKEQELIVHAHIVLANENGKVFGGHLMPGCIISATGELILIEAADARIQRKFDERTKLYL